MTIEYSPSFADAYCKLKIAIRERAKSAEHIFRKDPFDARLKTHKLHGRLSGTWAFSIDVRHRIIFEFYGRDVVRFLAIGDHDIYR